MDLREACSSVVRLAPAALRADVAILARDLEFTSDPAGAMIALRRRLADPTTDRVVEAMLLGLETGQTERLLRLLADELRADEAVAGRLVRGVPRRRVWR